jgi:hypothetical protein
MSLERISQVLRNWAPEVVSLLSRFGYFSQALKKENLAHPELASSLGARFWAALRGSSDRKNAELWSVVLNEISGPVAVQGAMSVARTMGTGLSQLDSLIAFEKTGLSYVSRNSSRYNLLTETDILRMKSYVWRFRNVNERNLSKTFQRDA